MHLSVPAAFSLNNQQAGHWAGSYTGNAVAETLGKFALLVQKYFLLY
jgi:hypothetical protein